MRSIDMDDVLSIVDDLRDRMTVDGYCAMTERVMALPSAQPVANDTDVPSNDCISRQAAIDLVRDVCNAVMSGCESHYDSEVGDEVYDDILEVNAILTCNKEVRKALKGMPSAQPEIVRCRDCKHFDYNHPYIIQGVPVLGHEVCNAWGDGCKTDEDGYCFLAERRTDERSD